MIKNFDTVIIKRIRNFWIDIYYAFFLRGSDIFGPVVDIGYCDVVCIAQCRIGIIIIYMIKYMISNDLW